MEENGLAVIAILAHSDEAAAILNTILHEYSEWIIGRMGLPYREKNIRLISVALDAPRSIVSSLSGKIGKIPGVSARAVSSFDKK